MRSPVSVHPPRPADAPPAATVQPAVEIRGGGVRSMVLRLLLLAGSDLGSLFLAGALAYLAWARPVRGQSAELYLGLVPLLGLFLLGYAQAGLYPGFGLGPVEILRRSSLVTATGFLALAAVSFAFKLPYLFSRVTFALAFLLALLLVPLVRALVVSLAGRLRWWPQPVVLVGPAEEARRTLDALAGSAAMGYRPVGRLAPEPEPVPEGSDGGAGLPLLGGLERSAELSRRGVKVALLTGGLSEGRLLDRLQTSFERVVLLRGYGELPVEGLQVRNLGGVLGIEVTNNLLRLHNRALKRAMDLVLGSLSLLATLPLLLAAVAAVKLTSRGPAFFTQERAGLGGRTLRMPKIRTMYADAEARLERHLADDESLARQWREHMKLERDPRVLPGVGRLLRRFSLDELPQLWSVLTGDMSLVGPRPFPRYHLERFSPEFQELRQRVRPGLTGLWQVTARSEGSLEDQEALDTYYIRNGSLWLDLYVLGRTLATVVSGRGAY